MLELMKLECKKNLGMWEYSFVIIILVMGIGGSIMLLNNGPYMSGEELFGRSINGIMNITAAAVVIGGGIGMNLFGNEIKNSYVLPQGRKKIILAKVYIMLIFVGVIYIPSTLLGLSMFKYYPEGKAIILFLLILTNLLLAISLLAILMAVLLRTKSKILNQIFSLVLATVGFLIGSYGMIPIRMEELVFAPVVKYLGIVILIAIISGITYSVAFNKELELDI